MRKTSKLALIILAMLNGPAIGGTCLNYQSGGRTVQTCGNSSVETWGPHGRYSRWGERNAGFDRYPGMAPEPLFHTR